MGSTQSTSEENYNNNNNNTTNNITTTPTRTRTSSTIIENSDPWWPIENNINFTLEQPNLNEIINDISINLNNNNNSNNNRINNGNNFNNVKSDNNNLNQIKSETEQQLLLQNLNSDTIIQSSTSISSIDGVTDCNIVASVNKLYKTDKEQTLEEFKEELKIKRMARQTAISDLRDEIQRLRSQLNEEREINKKLRNGEQIINLKQMIDVSCSTNNDNDNIENIHAITIENNHFEQSLKEMVKQLQKDLAETHYNLQMTNSENLSLNDEVGVLKKQVNSLKDVISCSKQMIDVREEQVTQLKTKLTKIEESLADRETKLLSEDLRREYDKQMQNIRNLRQLYEERARVCAAERENLLRQIQIKKDELAAEIDKAKNLEERISTLENDVQINETKFEGKNSECNSLKYENRELKEEMNAINMLFSQMLMGFNGNNCLDIDRLTVMLEENRTLLNEMAIKEANYEGASLPKLLFDIVKQANNDDDNNSDEVKSIGILSTSIESISSLNNAQNGNVIENETTLLPEVIESTSSTVNVKQDKKLSSVSGSLVIKPETIISEELLEQNEKVKQENISALNTDEVKINLTNVELQQKELNLQGIPTITSNIYHTIIGGGKVVSAQEIIGNLPKVWRVITELLSHQKIEKVDFVENGQSEECYKSIQTASGIKPELSVSKTYIKLKNLILEKKSLVKETNRLKTLNSHLEYRLNEQEKRLSAVSLELQKTWHLVGRMQRQHRQLHTHEQILRYQLQQKRRLLSELKEELEYCRRKWAAAKAKNIDSQLQCDDMRKEFAKRRLEDSNNSAESGYSDGAGSGSGTDEEGEKDLLHTKHEIKKILPYKFVHDFIDNARNLERRNSLSASRTFMETNLRRCQSAPAVDTPVSFLDQQLNNSLNLHLQISEEIEKNQRNSEPTSSTSAGALSKDNAVNTASSIENESNPQYSDRTERIQRLEEQCKSLIARVLETSGSREKLELQIKRFQDEMPPAQHPIQNNINPKRRKSVSPENSQETTTHTASDGKGKLTEREEEYTRRRAERIQRLENESKQLMSRIRKTNDRGSTMVTRLKELHARCIRSREGSIDSSTDEDEKTNTVTQEKTEEKKETTEVSASISSPSLASTSSSSSSVSTSISASASASTTTSDSIPSSSHKIDIENDPSMKMLGKCAERLKRLEEESQMLLAKWTKNSERGTELENKLDDIHYRHGKNSKITNGSSETKNTDDSTNLAESSSFVALSRSDSKKTVEERLKEVENKANSRNERLKQMERDSQELISKLTKTSDRGSSMIDRLAEGRERRNSLRQEKLRKEQEIGTISCSDEELKDESSSTAETVELLTPHRKTATTPKVKTLPKTGVAAITLSRYNNKLKDQKSSAKETNSSSGSETLEEMFMRLSGLPTPGSSSTTNTSNDKDNSSAGQSNSATAVLEKSDKQEDDSQQKE